MIDTNDPNIEAIKASLNYIEQKELQNLSKAVKAGTILKECQIKRLEKLQKKLNSDTENISSSCNHIINGQYYIKNASDMTILFKLSERHIFRLLKEGAPKKTDNGFNATEWHLYLSERNKPKKAQGNKGLLEEKTIALRDEKAKIAKLERKVMEGNLIDIKLYRESEISRHTELAQEFKVLPSRVCGHVVGKSSAEVKAIIDSELKRILKYFENLLLHGRNKEDPAKSKAGRKKKIDKASKQAKE